MSARNLFFILFTTGLLFSIQACTDSRGKQEETVFKQVPEIQEVRPEKPAKIKLKRDAKDDYSWEISGDNVDEVIKADKRLRKDLKTE
ncbi:MAG: hypothetical protein C4560_11825 [Nitrospiraceae bacterium]|nr:MAG: hypothetical protein C4560_11825 [Nitrospiraceae bacterium]